MLEQIKHIFKGKDRSRDELERELRREAQYYAHVIVERLTQLDFCYRSHDKKEHVQRVKILRAVGTPEALYFCIDLLRMPRGVRTSQISDDDVLRDLSLACHRRVRFRESIEGGAWFVVERDESMSGIPREFSFSSAMESWPATSKPLIVPLGIGENRRIIYRSLAELPHALVGGATGAGKTTLLHSWICALIMHNQPRDLRLVLIDLKGGTEFTRYKSLPHLWNAGFVKSPGDVLPVLECLRDEMDARLGRFEGSEVQNIAVWNYMHRAEHLPRIVVFVDELAVIMLDKALKRRAEELLADLSARGRAPGFHLVLATQRPEVKVVSGLIKANLDARLAFRMTDNASSMVILDDVSAARMSDDTPPGRYVYKRGVERVFIQSALVTPGQVEHFVKSVIDGSLDNEIVSTISPEDILELALDRLNGSLSLRGLLVALEGKVREVGLRRILQNLPEIVEVRGEMYKIVSQHGVKGRRMIKLADLELGQANIGVGDGDKEVSTIHIPHSEIPEDDHE